LIEVGLLIQCIFNLLQLSPLGEIHCPPFVQTKIPAPKNDLRQDSLKLVKWLSEEDEQVKYLRANLIGKLKKRESPEL
jgi:hypothetical protein